METVRSHITHHTSHTTHHTSHTEVLAKICWPDEGAKQPSKRYGCSAVGIDSRVLCFGGTQGSAPNNELWLLEVGQSGKVEWKQPKVRGVAPSPRAAHTASLLAPPGRAATHMVVFGGAEADGFVLFDDASFLSLYPPEADGKGPQLIFRSRRASTRRRT